MKTDHARRRNGTSIAELPVTLWVFIFFMMLPLIDMVTLSYRGILAYSGVRQATTNAALQTSFSLAATAANSELGSYASSFTGIGYSTPPNVFVVQVDQSGNEKQGPANSPWPSPIVAADVYLIRVQTSATAAPLLNLGVTGNWNGVPGLTGPITLQFTYQVTAEHPSGLIN
jgi:hypothetical protein